MIKTWATLDFETRNTQGIDLKEVGPEAYAAHPATEILCMHIRWREGMKGDTQWTPAQGFHPGIAAKCEDPEVLFEAHNAFFEQMIWKYKMEPLGFPPMPPERWACTMAQAYFKGLPGGLEKAAAFANLGERKDTEASKIVYGLGKPMSKKDWVATRCLEGETKVACGKRYVKGSPETFELTPEQMKLTQDYCKQDCVVEEALSIHTGPLSDYERAVWELDQRINMRGMLLDLEFVQQANAIRAAVEDELLGEYRQLTTCELFPEGLAPTQLDKTKEWLGKYHGQWPASLDKAQLKVYGIGELEDDGEWKNPHNLHPDAYRALCIRAILGSSSVAKLPKMLAQVGPDGRSRGLLQYHGAGTGRWSGRGWQPHNMPRGLLPGKQPPADLIYLAIMGGKGAVETIFGKQNVLKAVASNLRSAIVAPEGKALFWADYSGVEMRTVLALAGEKNKTKMLATGEDVYSDMACKIYGIENPPYDGVKTQEWYQENLGITTEMRTIGKNTVLGCGFQMGSETFYERYLSHRPWVAFTPPPLRNGYQPPDVDEFSYKVIQVYRYEWAPEVPKLWYGLAGAALDAVKERTSTEFRGIKYHWVDNGAYLACELPDGQVMYYPKPLLKHEPNPKNPGDEWHWSFMSPTGSVTAYGGLLTENVVQKLARGFLCEAMHRLEAAGFEVILHVHDEIVAEGHADRAWEEYRGIMTARSQTAVIYDIPIAVEGAKATRYRK